MDGVKEGAGTFVLDFDHVDLSKKQEEYSDESPCVGCPNYKPGFFVFCICDKTKYY